MAPFLMPLDRDTERSPRTRVLAVIARRTFNDVTTTQPTPTPALVPTSQRPRYGSRIIALLQRQVALDDLLERDGSPF